MKIAQVTPFFAPAWSYGGPVKVCFDISRELVKRKHFVQVLTTDAYDHSKRIGRTCEEMDGIKVSRFKNVSNRLAKKSNLFLPRGFKKYFKDHVRDFDIVHLHSFYTYQNIICVKYCQKNKIPYVLHLHEMPAPIPLFKKTLVKKIFNILFGKKLLFGAAKIFVVSSSEKEKLISFMPQLKDQIEVVFNPIEISENKAVKPNRQKYNLKQTDKVLLFLGRLSFIKGLDRLILAFALLAKDDPSYKLIIAGPDEGEKTKLDQQIASLGISDNVIFPGLIEGKEKEELFASSDIFVLFSYYESFSLASLEAISHNLPVCLSKEVGIAKELIRFNCGKIVAEAENVRQSASELKWVYDNKAALAKDCKQTLAQFGLDKVVTKIVSIYNQIIKLGLIR